MATPLEQFKTSIGNISLGKKIAALLIIAGSIAGLTIFTLWANKQEMSVLYSNLSAEDAAAVIAKLKEQKIPYEIGEMGASILVPSDKVHELRLHLAGQGLPQGGGVGFEIFDRTTMGMTDFVQKLNYKRALQGELARTIGQLSEVEKARVHLVIPEKSIFAANQERARASVALKLKGGKQLSERQVQGIVHLISSSVEGLTPQDITIVDIHGQILTRVTSDSSLGQLTNSQMEHQKQFEKDLEGKVQTMLERIIGQERVVARVSADLEFKQVEKTEERFDPDTQVARSEQRSKEKSSGATTNPSGVPGPASNIPGAEIAGTQNQGSSNSSNSDRESETINYEISKTVSRIIEPVGAVRKLSVAVLVDGSYDATKNEKGELSRKYIPRSAEEMKKIEEIVKKTVGYSATREDQVEVVNIPFENVSVPEEEMVNIKNRNLNEWLPFVKYGVAAVGFILVFLFIVRPLMKGLTPSFERQLMIPNALPTPIKEFEVAELPLRDKVLEMTKQNPQQTALLVKKWLKEK